MFECVLRGGNRDDMGGVRERRGVKRLSRLVLEAHSGRYRRKGSACPPRGILVGFGRGFGGSGGPKRILSLISGSLAPVPNDRLKNVGDWPTLFWANASGEVGKLSAVSDSHLTVASSQHLNISFFCYCGYLHLLPSPTQSSIRVELCVSFLASIRSHRIV
jgi:hypothetical protein